MTGSIPKRAVTGSRPALHLVFTVVFLVGCGADTDGGASGTEDMFPRADFRFVVEDLGGAPDMRLPVDASVLMDADPMVVDAGTGAFDAGGGAGSEDGSVDMMNPDPPVPPSDPLSEEGSDTDGDGLDDAWEQGAGDELLLDWQNADTDGDGTPDGLEDFDGDGLTAAQEQAAGRMEA